FLDVDFGNVRVSAAGALAPAAASPAPATVSSPEAAPAPALDGAFLSAVLASASNPSALTGNWASVSWLASAIAAEAPDAGTGFTGAALSQPSVPVPSQATVRTLLSGDPVGTDAL